MDTTPPPSDADQATLRLLGLLHYVYAGFGMLGGLLLGGHYWLMTSGMGAMQADGPPPYFLTLVGGIYAVLGLWLLLNIVLNLVAGHGLYQRRWWPVVVIASAMNSLHMPLGTLLGVFTLVTVLKAPVRAAFR